jgi:hypothetical protein
MMPSSDLETDIRMCGVRVVIRVELGDAGTAIEQMNSVGGGCREKRPKIELFAFMLEGESGEIDCRRREGPNIVRGVHNIGGRDDLAHMLESPPIERSSPPVRKCHLV